MLEIGAKKSGKPLEYDRECGRVLPSGHTGPLFDRSDYLSGDEYVG